MRSYLCSSFGTASYLCVSEKILSLGESFASSAFRRDRSQPVAYGNRSQPSVYLYEGDKLCAKKERSKGFGYFAISNEVYQLSKRYQKIKSCTVIRLTNKISKKFEELFYQDFLLIRSERTLLPCISRNRLRKNYPTFLDLELQIWLAEGA